MMPWSRDGEFINDYYWSELEPVSDGYGDKYILGRLRADLGIVLTWDELMSILREHGYEL